MKNLIKTLTYCLLSTLIVGMIVAVSLIIEFLIKRSLSLRI